MTNNQGICIPKINSDIKPNDIKIVFNMLNICKIKDIKIVGLRSKTVFINVQYWYQSEYAQGIRKRLLDGHTVNIVYDFPWFWKCVMTRNDN